MAVNYREDPSFKPLYTHEDPETGIEVDAPFPVAVFGIDPSKTFLGVGNVVGAVETSFGDNPVIELEDIEDGKNYTVLGIESWWSFPVPKEVIEHMTDGSLAVDSVRHYLNKLRADEELADAADNAWLEEHGIDPQTEA